jgi:hypothetical protein
MRRSCYRSDGEPFLLLVVGYRNDDWRRLRSFSVGLSGVEARGATRSTFAAYRNDRDGWSLIRGS